MEDYNGINWSILSHASLLAMILGSFSMLLGTGIQVYITLNCDVSILHWVPTGAVCINRGTEQYFNWKEHSKSSKCYVSFLRAQLDIGNEIEGIVLVVLVIVIGKPW